MRVLLDTNVLVSALASRGLCADVFRAVIAGHELVVAPPLLAELRRVLQTKFRVPAEAVADALWLLEQDAIAADPEPATDVELKDRSDVPILSAATNGQADVLVTGDRELLAVRRVGKLRILSPRQFWERIRRGRGRGPAGR